MMKLRTKLIAIAAIVTVTSMGGSNFGFVANAATNPKQDPVQIEATGDGAKWSFTYTQYGVESKNLMLPSNKKIKFNISTVGTNDSLWIPQLGLKVDANQFQDVQAEINTSNPRNFKIMSISICNAHHKHMVMSSGNVVTPSSFSSWIKSQGGRLA